METKRAKHFDEHDSSIPARPLDDVDAFQPPTDWARAGTSLYAAERPTSFRQDMLGMRCRWEE